LYFPADPYEKKLLIEEDLVLFNSSFFIFGFFQMNQLATMSDLVLKGIEQAQEDLRKESDDALWQEGILRHVPIVGSIYNWISPIQKVGTCY
jgi:hypothetical protein